MNARLLDEQGHLPGVDFCYVFIGLADMAGYIDMGKDVMQIVEAAIWLQLDLIAEVPACQFSGAAAEPTVVNSMLDL